MVTAATLAATGAGSAVAAALILRLAWGGAGLPAVHGVGAAAVVGAALAADVVHVRTGRLRPLAVHRQVPQAWGHARSSVVVAARYGLRLGVGPATILTTWLWWAAMLLGVSNGVGSAVLVALAFVVARTAATVAVTAGVGDGRAMAGRMARVVAVRAAVSRTGAVAALVGAAALLAR